MADSEVSRKRPDNPQPAPALSQGVRIGRESRIKSFATIANVQNCPVAVTLDPGLDRSTAVKRRVVDEFREDELGPEEIAAALERAKALCEFYARIVSADDIADEKRPHKNC